MRTHQLFPLKRTIYALLLLGSWWSPAFAQHPELLVDLNIASRQEAEVNEPGYHPWPLQGAVESLTLSGISFSLSGSYDVSWYKAGVQSPYYARLANDGLKSQEYASLRISGLPAGTHSLLTWHNSFDNPETNTFSPMDIYLNGELVYDNLVMSNRVTENAAATSAYFIIQVSEGEDVELRFEPESDSDASAKIACLCGFELNTPNALKQASRPLPADGDSHVDADTGSHQLSWSPAADALSHDIYFGREESQVKAATPDSAAFQTSQTDSSFIVSGLYSMEDYYWRIDEHDSLGLITRGDVWHFRPRQTAFPGAEGYGRYAIGGRGGVVVEVTNLEDSGPGSLRAAIENDLGPRTIVFRVSGIIELKSRLTLVDDRVSVAGQTAPGKGICISRAPFGLSGVDDAIVRHMRVRLGSGTTYDGMGMAGCDHSILDHCSISWTIDEGFSSRNGKNITLQRTLISEALNVAGHANYPDGTAHGYAASIGGDIGSFHHNLLAHCAGRNWSLAGGLDGDGFFAGRLDIFNNVVYNWNYRVTDGGAHEVNFVANYYKPGAAWDRSTRYALKAEYESFPGTQRYYFTGNIMGGVFDESNQTDGRIFTGSPNGYSPWAPYSFFPSRATIHPVRLAYKLVLSDVGASQPGIDDHDRRVIGETLDSTWTYRGSYTGLPGIPDSQNDVGGWEEYPQMQRHENWDSDHDGLPDWWEESLGLNPESDPGDYSESNADPNRDGYTRLEDYLQWMAGPHHLIASDSVLSLSLKELFRGFEMSPEFSIVSVNNGEAILKDDSLVVFNPSTSGLAGLEVMVRDAAGDSLLRSIAVFAGDVAPDSVIENPSTSINPVPLAAEDFRLHCFPNPAENQVSIYYSLPGPDDVEVYMYDMKGREVYSHRLSPGERSGTLTVGIAGWNPGIYMLAAYSGGSRRSLLFVKQ